MNVRLVARWAVRAVPGVYGAAREAGLGRGDAARVVEGSAYAFALARKRYPKRWRPENAVRHFVWQAWITATYGRPVAEAVGRAHERLSSDARDSSVDRENNRIGQEYGEAHAVEVGGDAMRPAQSVLADEAGRLWTAGQLSGGSATTG
ncbi:MAG: hypothetical protein ABIO16_05725 [Nocardioides sp.]